VALGTIFLAGATWRVANQTKRVAEAAIDQGETVRDQTTVTRSALQASVQPWLTRVTPPPETANTAEEARRLNRGPHVVYVERDDDSLKVTLWLRNVGRGLALIQAQEGTIIEGTGPDGSVTKRFGFLSAAALPPHDQTRIGFTVEHVDPDPSWAEMGFGESSGCGCATQMSMAANWSGRPST
jgi:hypothetical protein